MRNVRIMGLCLIAIFAMSAIAAASASAAEAPEYFSCVKKKGGNYEKGCATKSAPGEGAAELEPVLAKTKFTSKSKAATFTVNGTIVTCKKDTDAGEFVGNGVALVEITFTKCNANGNKKELCETAGAGAGTIKTGRLTDALLYLNPEETQLGVILLRNGPWTEFKCGATSFTVDGFLIGSITNTKKGDTLSFKVVGGHQEYKTAWEEGSEVPGLDLFTEPGEVEATLETTDEQSSKGIGAYPF